MKFKFFILIISFCLINNLNCFSQVRLKTPEFKKLLTTAKNYQLIDVRTPTELKEGIIKNSYNIDYYSETFEKQIKNLDTNKMTFVYCSCGGRSEEAIKLMNQWGFKSVFELEDGYNDWVKSGYETVKKK